MFRFLARLFLLVLMLAPFVLVGLVLAMLDDTPLVAGSRSPEAGDIRRARTLLAEHDPRSLRDAEVRSISVSDEDVEVVANYLLGRLRPVAVAWQTRDDGARCEITLALPRNPVGGFLNLQARFRESDGLPALHGLKVGRVPVPAVVALPIGRALLSTLITRTGLPDPTAMVQAVAFSESSTTLTYQWQAQLVADMRSRLVPAAEQARLAAYNSALVRVLGSPGRTVPLVQVLGPMMAFADERARGGDAAAENRAALVVLAAWADGRSLALLAPEAGDWPQPPRATPMLLGRRDLAQHFLISAALAATGGGALSMAVGLSKEVDDSRGGSGFSFIDLAADEAGSRYGELAVAADTASLLAGKTAGGVAEADLLPLLPALEERLEESQFKVRYGDVGSERYREVLARIRAHIGRSPLYGRL